MNFVELLVHGYNHNYGEFLNIGKWTAKRKILSAEKIFNESGLSYKKIFRAPHWLLGDATYGALSELGYSVADHRDNLTPRELRCYQYNWSINEPVPDLNIIRGHGHIQNVCGNGLEEHLDNLLKLPKDAYFATISEYLGMDSSVITNTNLYTPKSKTIFRRLSGLEVSRITR